MTCHYCDRIIKGGRITRSPRDCDKRIAPCKKVPSGVKYKMERLVLEGKRDTAKKRRLNEEIEDSCNVEVEEVEMFRNPTAPGTTTTRKGKKKVPQISTQSKRKGVSKRSPTSND